MYLLTPRVVCNTGWFQFFVFEQNVLNMLHIFSLNSNIFFKMYFSVAMLFNASQPLVCHLLVCHLWLKYNFDTSKADKSNDSDNDVMHGSASGNSQVILSPFCWTLRKEISPVFLMNKADSSLSIGLHADTLFFLFLNEQHLYFVRPAERVQEIVHMSVLCTSTVYFSVSVPFCFL